MDELQIFKTQLKELVFSLRQDLIENNLEAREFLEKIDFFILNNDFIYNYLISLVLSEFKEKINIIVSGEFGKTFYEKFKSIKKINILLIESIRNNKGIIRIIRGEINEENKTIFIEDSLFSGFTYSSIDNNFTKIDKSYIVFLIPKENNRDILPKNLFYIFDYWEEMEDSEIILKNIFINK